MIAVAVACLPVFFTGHLDRPLRRRLVPRTLGVLCDVLDNGSDDFFGQSQVWGRDGRPRRSFDRDSPCPLCRSGCPAEHTCGLC